MQNIPYAVDIEERQIETPVIPASSDPTAGTLGTVGTASASSSDKIKNVTVNIEKLVERFEIHTTNLQGTAGVKRTVGRGKGDEEQAQADSGEADKVCYPHTGVHVPDGLSREVS